MADKAEMAEAKPDAKESIKDAKKDNDSKNEETKNGEKEEDDESSDEEEHEGLYDKPVVIEGKRERKTTVFLASQTPQTISVPKPLLFKGKGESLGSMERTNHEIGRSTAVELKPLHKLLFGRDGRAPEIKKNIRKFNGFAFEKDSKEYEAKKFNVERFTNDGLKRLCEIFDLEKKGKRSDLQEKVMDFLMSPKSSGRPAPQPKSKKSEEKKRKRSKKDTPKSKTSSTSKKASETVESGDDDDEEDEDEEMDEEEEEEEEEEDEQEEPPKKKKKAESTPKKTESSPKKTKSTPKKTETTPKKGKETKAVKEKAKDKDKGKSKEKPKAKKTDEKTKASKKKEPVPVKITPLKKPSPKKPAKKEKPAPVEDDSSDEEPLAKKTKKDAPSNSDLEKIVKGLLEGADLEKVTMKSVCKQVYDMFPDHDLTSRKDFIKETVRKVIS